MLAAEELRMLSNNHVVSITSHSMQIIWDFIGYRLVSIMLLMTHASWKSLPVHVNHLQCHARIYIIYTIGKLFIAAHTDMPAGTTQSDLNGITLAVTSQSFIQRLNMWQPFSRLRKCQKDVCETYMPFIIHMRSQPLLVNTAVCRLFRTVDWWNQINADLLSVGTW